MTDLTGTTWTISKDFTALASYGEFDVDGSLSFSDGSGLDFTYLAIGLLHSTNGYYGAEGWVTCVTTDGEYKPAKTALYSSDFSVTFTGGADVKNADLISWLETNGKMKITNLTGTTWRIPIGWSVTKGYGVFYVNVTGLIFGSWSYTSYTYHTFKIGYSSNSAKADYMSFYREDNTFVNCYPSYDTIFTITGGTDATNADLISWLEANGTMLTLTDIGNTTWYVPSGWSVESGYGQFSCEGTLNGYPFSTLAIGYNKNGSPANCITNEPMNLSYVSNVALTITITSSNVTNAKLVSWLETNGTMLKVTDLTDTTWTIPSGWSATEGYGRFSVNLNMGTNTTNTYTNFDIGYVDNVGGKGINTLQIYNSSTTRNLANGASYTFHFTGGTDITNPALIAWLQENGEMQTKPTKVFTRLYIGNTVATAGSKCFKKLITQATQ